MPSRYSHSIPVGEAQAYLDSLPRNEGRSVGLHAMCNRTTGQFFYVAGGMLYVHWEFIRSRGFVGSTTAMPHRVVPRPGVEDGIVDTVAKNDLVYHRGMTEINPYEVWPELKQED